MSNEDLVQELKDRIEVLEKGIKATRLAAGFGFGAFLWLVLDKFVGPSITSLWS